MSARSDWQNEQIERAQNIATIAALRESMAAKDRELADLDRQRVLNAMNAADMTRQRDEWKARAEQEAKRLDWALKFYSDGNPFLDMQRSRAVIDAAISGQEPPK